MVYLNYNTNVLGNVTSSDSLYGADDFEVARRTSSSVKGAQIKFDSNSLKLQHDDVRIYNTVGGSTNPQPTLRVFGRTRCNSYLTLSDDRYKHNEIDISNALITIRKLKPKKYDKTSIPLEADFSGNLGDIENHKESGLIAQEVEKIEELSHSVLKPETEDDLYAVNYTDIFAYLIKAVQELDAKVINLEAILNKNNLL